MPSTPKSTWAVGSLSRRARRRGMIVSGLVGVVTLGLGLFTHAKPPPDQSVVVAATTLVPGSLITAADVSTIKVPAPGVPHAITTLGTVINRQVVYPVAAGQPLVPADLSRHPILQGIPRGDVGVMLPVSLASSDNVQPNDIVDVIWLGNSGTSGGPNVPPGTIIASGLRVLKVLNQNGGPVQGPGATGIDATTPAVVEVAVPAQDAGALAVAAASGRFWLALDPWATLTRPTVAHVLTSSMSAASATPSASPSAARQSHRAAPSATLARPSHRTLPSAAPASSSATAGHRTVRARRS